MNRRRRGGILTSHKAQEACGIAWAFSLTLTLSRWEREQPLHGCLKPVVHEVKAHHGLVKVRLAQRSLAGPERELEFRSSGVGRMTSCAMSA